MTCDSLLVQLLVNNVLSGTGNELAILIQIAIKEKIVYR